MLDEVTTMTIPRDTQIAWWSKLRFMLGVPASERWLQIVRRIRQAITVALVVALVGLFAVAQWTTRSWWVAALALVTATVVALLFRQQKRIDADFHEFRRVAQGEHVAVQIAWDRAKLSDMAKSQFLTYVAHDLRAPLIHVLEAMSDEGRDEPSNAAMVSTPGSFALACATPSCVQSRMGTDVVRSAMQEALARVEQILDYTGSEAESTAGVCEDIDIFALITTVVDQLALPVRERGLHVHLRWDAAVQRGAIVSPFGLRYVVYNLLNNAIHASERDDITIEVACESGDDQSFDLELRVADRSVALWTTMLRELALRRDDEKEDLAAWYVTPLPSAQPLTRLSSAHTRHCGPVYIYRQVREVVRELGGEIAVLRREGGGVEVCARLRVGRSQEMAEPVPASARERHESLVPYTGLGQGEDSPLKDNGPVIPLAPAREIRSAAHRTSPAAFAATRLPVLPETRRNCTYSEIVSLLDSSPRRESGEDSHHRQTGTGI